MISVKLFRADQSRIKPIWCHYISLSRDYTTLPYLMIKQAQTVGVNDLSCLEHTKQSSSVTEIVA